MAKRENDRTHIELKNPITSMVESQLESGGGNDMVKNLAANLLPFQREGVSWMYNQEINVKEVKGGILADEMGMGKTLQTITVILDNRPTLQNSKISCKHPPNLSDLELKDRKSEDILWKDAIFRFNSSSGISAAVSSRSNTKIFLVVSISEENQVARRTLFITAAKS